MRVATILGMGSSRKKREPFAQGSDAPWVARDAPGMPYAACLNEADPKALFLLWACQPNMQP